MLSQSLLGCFLSLYPRGSSNHGFLIRPGLRFCLRLRLILTLPFQLRSSSKLTSGSQTPVYFKQGRVSFSIPRQLVHACVNDQSVSLIWLLFRILIRHLMQEVRLHSSSLFWPLRLAVCNLHCSHIWWNSFLDRDQVSISSCQLLGSVLIIASKSSFASSFACLVPTSCPGLTRDLCLGWFIFVSYQVQFFSRILSELQLLALILAALKFS